MNKLFTKKSAIIFAVVVLIVLMSVMLVACGEKGDTGMSAYEIAVKNGFNGTEVEWLKSLEGDKGSVSNPSDEYIAENIMSCVNIEAVYTKLGNNGGDFVSYGTGIIIEDDKTSGSAYILTNYHVVYDAINTANIRRSLTVYLYGSEYIEMGITAKFIGGSADFDMAVIEISNSDIYKKSDAQATDIGDSDKISVGETVRAIGNGGAEGLAVSEGIISVDSLYINVDVAGASRTLRTIRTDASINGGNSGGGLFDEEGKLIGLVNAKTVDVEIEGMGYALPINDIKPLADKIIKGYKENGIASNPKVHLLGLTVGIEESWAKFDKESNTITIKETVFADDVELGGVAAKAGVRAGDRILSVRHGGKLIEIDREYKLFYACLAGNEGDEVVFNVSRDGVEMTLTGKLGAGTILD